PFRPRSPYAAAKLYAHWVTCNYREAYGIHASNGILFNHESERRGETFVTRKITRAVARIVAGIDKNVFLGNLDARRDWGHAKDYVQAMWLMLQRDEPGDFVIGTGQSHAVRDFVAQAFAHVGLRWEPFVEFDASYLRPTEVEFLEADPRRANDVLGWHPRVTFDQLVQRMVESDLAENGMSLERGRDLAAARFREASLA
ncbi:MAG: GDP-mannose 4,6-dehydratase, partial [Phycisphaeraceae bacterium]